MTPHLPINPLRSQLQHTLDRTVPAVGGPVRCPASIRAARVGAGVAAGDAWISEQPSRVRDYGARCAGYPNPGAGSVDAKFKPFCYVAGGLLPFKLGAGRRGSRSADLYIQRGRRGLTARARSIFSRSLPALQASNSGL